MSSLAAVFAVFLRLGVTSFGGPIAHLAYFRDEFVARRRWESDSAYGELVALCQFLPGPASSQVGFAVGLRRAGLAGGLAAFAAFTLPSAALMVAAAASVDTVSGPVSAGVIDGLKIVAVAVVAHAVWGMARSLAPDRPRGTIALAAAVGVLLVGGPWAPVVAIAIAGIAGALWLREPDPAASVPAAARVTVDTAPPPSAGRRVGITALVVLVVVAAAAPVLARVTGNGAVALFDAFFRAGALVFGGGHVVLPLLESAVVEPGWVDAETFLAGYGAAQALPGPLFAFAGYLGALADVGPGGVAGAVIALLAIFLPGFLLLLAVLPVWAAVRRRPRATAAVGGASAAVVGILGAALYDPVFTTAIVRLDQFALALVCFGLLALWRCPAWVIVLLGAAAGAASGALVS
ncbi:chromate efflux transporter [Microbacterium oleivorans]|uniref:Chromate efflux transporter n=1 Tax=Microbacterium oleivorans TaxID=273677 RepID=A0A7D5IWJ1_9MICO|nr:chromate efflux transporter [Microbacterium oleivorans]QLD11116.1 chromate efflux transporter [Microbacterium oleivorans]